MCTSLLAASGNEITKLKLYLTTTREKHSAKSSVLEERKTRQQSGDVHDFKPASSNQKKARRSIFLIRKEA
jgi:hypothetical protein